MKYKILVFAVVLMLLSLTVSAASELSVVYDNGKITCDGTSKANMPVQIFVLKNGVSVKDIENVDYSELMKWFQYAGQTYSDKHGNYSFDNIPVSVDEKNSIVIVNGYNEEFITKAYCTYEQTELNAKVQDYITNTSKTFNDLKELVDNYYIGLNINYDFIKSLDNSEITELYTDINSNITSENISDFEVLLKNKIAIYSISRIPTIENFESVLKILMLDKALFYSDYKSLSETDKQSIIECVINETELSEIEKILTEQTLIKTIKISLWNDCYPNLNKYEEELNLDLSKMDILTDEGLKKVALDIKSKIESATIVNVKTLQDEIYSSTEKNKNAGKNTVSNGGSGSSGGSGGKSSFNGMIGETIGVVQPEIIPFTDLDSVTWAKVPILKLHAMNIINGKSENIFEPMANVTREEFTAMVVRAFNFQIEGEKREFDDVTVEDWSYESIIIASSNGIVNGIGDGCFKPKGNISRQDMAVIIYNAAIKSGYEFKSTSKSTYMDTAEIASYATKAVDLLSNESILTGNNNIFNPISNATRAEAAVVIYRVLDCCNKLQ